jgi:hypothetical protein
MEPSWPPDLRESAQSADFLIPSLLNPEDEPHVLTSTPSVGGIKVIHRNSLSF